MSFAELQGLVRRVGLVDALNLDGGGSTTMVVQGAVVNHPSDATGPPQGQRRDSGQDEIDELANHELTNGEAGVSTMVFDLLSNSHLYAPWAARSRAGSSSLRPPTSRRCRRASTSWTARSCSCW